MTTSGAPQPCAICARLASWKAGENPFVVRELEHSLVVVGDHDTFPGYAMLLSKVHVREMHELPPAAQTGLLAELMRVGAAVAAEYAPWKLNYSCYGNQDPHVHWHVFPRYADDAKRTSPPWLRADEFAARKLTPEAARAYAARLAAALSR